MPIENVPMTAVLLFCVTLGWWLWYRKVRRGKVVRQSAARRRRETVCRNCGPPHQGAPENARHCGMCPPGRYAAKQGTD